MFWFKYYNRKVQINVIFTQNCLKISGVDPPLAKFMFVARCVFVCHRKKRLSIWVHWTRVTAILKNLLYVLLVQSVVYLALKNIELPFLKTTKVYLGILLKLDAVFFSEMLVYVFKTTHHFICKDWNLHCLRHLQIYFCNFRYELRILWTVCKSTWCIDYLAVLHRFSCWLPLQAAMNLQFTVKKKTRDLLQNGETVWAGTFKGRHFLWLVIWAIYFWKPALSPGLNIPEALKEFNSHFGLAVVVCNLKSTCVLFSDSSAEVKVVHFIRDGQWLRTDRIQYRRFHSTSYLTLQIEPGSSCEVCSPLC